MTLGQEPKTRRSRRTVPVARSVMRQVEDHLARFVDADPDALVFTAPRGGPLARSLFARRVWRPAAKRAALPGITFHGLRHSFVAILVAAGCNVREVSEWAGHNNVAFTLTRYGGCSRTARTRRSTAWTPCSAGPMRRLLRWSNCGGRRSCESRLPPQAISRKCRHTWSGPFVLVGAELVGVGLSGLEP